MNQLHIVTAGGTRNRTRMTGWALDDRGDEMLRGMAGLCNLKVLDCQVIPLSLEFVTSLAKSKWWKNISRISLTIVNDDYDPRLLKFDSAIKILGSNGHLTHLNLEMRFFIDSLFDLAISPNLSKLRSLRISGRRMNGTDLRILIGARKNTLEELYMERSDEIDEDAIEQLGNVPNLHTLGIHLSVCYGALPKLESLTKLILRIDHFSNDKYTKGTLLPNSLPRILAITIFTVQGTYSGMTKSTQNFFDDLATACPNLEKIELHYDDYTDTDFKLLHIFSHYSKLEEMSFHSKLGDVTRHDPRIYQHFYDLN